MNVLSRLGALFVGLAAALWLWGQDHAGAETQYFPIPTVSTSKNDGNDVGLIAPILITEPDGYLKYIVAPMFVVNSFVGPRATINLFRYEPGGRELRFVGSFSEKIERKLLFSYIDPAFSNGRYSLAVGASFFKDATRRFFGLGERTLESDQTNYTGREIRANWKFGVYANEVTQIAVGQRYRDMEIQRGVVEAFPFTAQQFPTVAGINGASIVGHRVTFHYDTRDSLVTPTDGMQVTAYAELNQNLKNEAHPLFSRYELEVKKLFPSESKRAILVVRADLQATLGTQVPFYEQSSLGGQNNLRGFGVDRYIDKHLISASIEERIHVLRAKIAGTTADFEVAPFIDTGQVFNSYKDVSFKDYRITPGLGFRALVRPNVVGRVDYGFSREGGAVFAGLDFPY